MADERDRKIPRALIHAFEKTGFIVTDENRALFTDEDLEAWNTAVEEGEQLYGKIGDRNPETDP